MKKALLPLTLIILISFSLVGSAEAKITDVACFPDPIGPGGTTTITVYADKEGIGSIRVTQPNAESSSAWISIPSGGGSDSKKYPDDFSGGSTTQLGEYTVRVNLFGWICWDRFYVSFFVITESPLGTIMATTASLSTLIGLVAVKRLRTKRRLN